MDDPLLSNIARRALARDGIEAIWSIYEAAATAHRSGRARAADFMIEIADAAEEIWHQQLVEKFGPPR